MCYPDKSEFTSFSAPLVFTLHRCAGVVCFTACRSSRVMCVFHICTCTMITCVCLCVCVSFSRVTSTLTCLCTDWLSLSVPHAEPLPPHCTAAGSASASSPSYHRAAPRVFTACRVSFICGLCVSDVSFFHNFTV